MKTRDDVEDLKRNWEGDPCYDLDDVAGFESYREELRAYRETTEEFWRQEVIKRRERRAIELGIEGNLALITYLETIEARLKKLEDA